MVDRSKVIFWFDGNCSADLGIFTQGFPTFTGAEPRVTKYEIPGRNGDLTYWDGSYSNTEGEIECAILSADNVGVALTTLNQWVAAGGYKKLVLSSEPGRYRMARLVNAAEVAVRMQILAPFVLMFDCKPQKYFEDDSTVNLPSGEGEVYNPYSFAALPVIRGYFKKPVTGDYEIITIENDEGSFDIAFSIDAASAAKWVDIDLENKSAVNELGQNIPLTTFEAACLRPGANKITLSQKGVFDRLEIYPRWWTL